jgi:hypothetical protein
MDDPGNGCGSRFHRDTGGGDCPGLDPGDDAPSRRQRPQPSGAQNRRVARERAKELAEAGQLELKFLVRVADCEPLILTSDLSENDLQTSVRLSSAVAELWSDMVRHYAKRLEEQQREPSSLYRLELAKSSWGIS